MATSPPSQEELADLLTEKESIELSKTWLHMTQPQRDYVTNRLAGKRMSNAVEDGKGRQRAYEFEKTPAVARYMQLATRSAVRRTVLTRQDVLGGLLDAVEAAATSAELTAAWREIGRVIGAYEPDKIEIGVSLKELDPKVLAAMSTRELLAAARFSAEGTVVDGEFDVQREAYSSIVAALEPPKRITDDD